MLGINGLCCGYQSGFSLRDINLQIEDCEMVGIIGPNGSGKTTLMRAITRILKPERGTIELNGRDIAGMTFRDLARQVAVASQSAEGGTMTVEDFVMLGRMPYFRRFQFIDSMEDRQTAVKAMELTDCLRLRHHSMGEISGGERQLALVARALAQEPKLLLLDEPTAHLDITHQVGILDLVRRLNRDIGLAVVMVLHDLNFASEYCHRLILLNEGRVYREGTPDEVIDYRVIEEVYRTVVVVDRNPISNKPFVLAISEEDREGRRDAGR